jgi:DUF4097 and DUF4098 domain-containing protein YvlB
MNKKWLAAVAIILVMLGLCAAMITTLVITIGRIPAGGIGGLHIDLAQIKAEGDEAKSFSVSGPAVLDVREPFGKVDIQTGAGNQIVVKAHKTAFGFNQQDAENELASLKLVMNQEGNKLTLSREDTADQGLVINSKPKPVDYTIIVPVETTVTVKADMGEIHLKGTTGKADLQTSFGLIDVSGIQGGLAVTSNNGAVHAKSISAGKNTIDLHSGFGEILLADSSAGDVTVKSDNGRITLTNVEGSGVVNISSSFGSIDYQNGKGQSLVVKSNNGGLSLTGLTVQKGVSASSDFGAITLKQVAAGSYDVSSKNGNVTLEGASGPIKADSDFGRISISQATRATLDVQTKNGNILFDGSLGDGPHSITTDFGAVTVRLPAEAALNVDLKTNLGSINSDFDIAMNGSVKDKNWVGKIGSGGPALAVQSNNGNITIEKTN